MPRKSLITQNWKFDHRAIKAVQRLGNRQVRNALIVNSNRQQSATESGLSRRIIKLLNNQRAISSRFIMLRMFYIHAKLAKYMRRLRQITQRSIDP
jgi:hypothetical protein